MAGEIMQKGSMAQRLLEVSKALVGHITGGMAHISVLTSLFYGALSGSSPATVAAALKNSILAMMVPIIVLGGIYGGLTTPTEAGVIAVVYAFLVEGLVLRTLSWQKVWDILRGTALTTSSIFLVVATATALGQILLFYNVPDAL
ncbi:unnamed protein product, partial [Cyprideis torosa]